MSVNVYSASLNKLTQIAGNGVEGAYHKTGIVTALSGATSVTITDDKIHSNSLIMPFADDGTTTPLPTPKTTTLTKGQCVLTFDPLERDTQFLLVVLAENDKPGISASDITYDNTDSDLSATDVQGALDEIVYMIGDVENLLEAL